MSSTVNRCTSVHTRRIPRFDAPRQHTEIDLVCMACRPCTLGRPAAVPLLGSPKPSLLVPFLHSLRAFPLPSTNAPRSQFPPAPGLRHSSSFRYYGPHIRRSSWVPPPAATGAASAKPAITGYRLQWPIPGSGSSRTARPCTTKSNEVCTTSLSEVQQLRSCPDRTQAPSWCEPLAVLRSLYGFAHAPIGSEQSASHIALLCGLLQRFTSGHVREANDNDADGLPVIADIWPGLPVNDAAALREAVAVLRSPWLTWFPTFGCALLGLGPATGDDVRPRPGELDLHLLALDEWGFHVHSHAQGTQHSTICGGYRVLPCGAIPVDRYKSLVNRVHVIVSKALKQRQKRNKGFQRTPGFIHAAVRMAVAAQATADSGSADAASEVESSLLPKGRGGFTDVGQHTGGDTVRETSWPLVKAVLQFALEYNLDRHSSSSSNRRSLLLTGDRGVALSSHCHPSAGTKGNDGGGPSPSLRAPASPPPPLLPAALAHLDLWLLHRQLRLINADTATPTALTAVMQMLSAAAIKGAALSDDGYDMTAFEAACRQAQAHLDRVAAERALQVASRYELPELGSAALRGTCNAPSGSLPEPLLPRTEEGGLAAARQRAERNLGSLPLLTPGVSFSAMLTWLDSRGAWPKPAGDSGDVAAQLVLRSVEREMFWRAAEGFDAPINQLDLAEVGALEAAVDEYRTVVQQFLEKHQQQPPPSLHQQQAPAVMRVELLSRELLVVWISYCLMRQAAAKEHPIVSRYGVALRHTDLRHLVLSDRAAVDAALAVAAYLQRGSLPGSGLFSLRSEDGCGEATLRMAEEYAQGCPRLQRIWALECQDAEARVKAHWEEVMRKQAEARRLRTELASLEAEGRLLQSKLNDVKYHSNYNAIRTAQRRMDENSSAQSTTSHLLQEAEKAPPAVLQPLPKSGALALRWLFFLHMPPLLRHLSRASFLAQQMLLPSPISAEVAGAVSLSFKENLTSYYNAQRGDLTYVHSGLQQASSGSQGHVMLWSLGKHPELDKIGPSHIDNFYSSSDGVWYPDSLGPAMAWRGSGSATDSVPQGCFDPFTPLEPRLVELYFTEMLPAVQEGGEGQGGVEGSLAEVQPPLQWAMHVRASASDTPADRGNLGISRQDTKPAWLTKPGFLQFTALRAFPVRQLQNLCVALHDRLLPLDQPAVHVLVQQLLYHIGVLTTEDQPPRLLWREGWEREGDVLPTLCRELDALAEELQDKRREHEAVLLLGVVAAYLAAWHPPCRAVARRFAAMTAQGADELELEVDAASNNEEATAALLAKQYRWRCMALLCYGCAGDGLSREDVGAMLQLAVLIRHGTVFLRDPALRASLAPLLVRARNVLAARAQELVSAVADGQRGSDLLTAAAARVLPRYSGDNGAEALRWEQLPGNAASFEAVRLSYSGEPQLLSINLLDGTVLVDGWPPNRLPREVTEHALYRRTFGEWNFQLSGSGAGTAAGSVCVLEGLRLINGRRYRFALGPAEQGGRLVITEVDPRVGEELELLDVGTDGCCGAWGPALPTRLRELYSHWLSRRHGVMVLRPPSFLEHDVHFIGRCTALPSAVPPSKSPPSPAVGLTSRFDVYHLRRVPRHLQSRHWTELLQPHLRSQLPDRLVLLRGSAVLDCLLSKFETPDFIHVYTCDDDPQLLRLELPRFGLEFELRRDSGRVLSRDYSGYQLHRRQLLVWDESGQAQEDKASLRTLRYTLPEFRQYLVLERVPYVVGPVLGSRREDMLVLVPEGKVVGQMPYSDGAFVRVLVSGASGASLKAHCYEVHGRFRHLRAPAIPARLQLAALYAATGTALPEPGSRATGGQMALELLRQCWSDRPLDPRALAQLRSVGRLGGHLTPALRLLSLELEASAGQIRHLHAAMTGGSGAPATEAMMGGNDGNADAGIDYLQTLREAGALLPGGWGPNPRGLLTPTEERRSLGLAGLTQVAPTAAERLRPAPAWVRRGLFKPIVVSEPLPVGSMYVTKVEERLSRLVEAPGGAASSRRAKPAYPLMDLSAAVAGSSLAGGEGEDGLRTGRESIAGGQGGPSTPLQLEMHRELADSWEEHHSAPFLEDYRLRKGTEKELQELQAAVTARREALESYLFRHLSCVPEHVGCHGSSFRMLRSAGLVPTVSATDLLRAAWRRELLRQLSPFLSAASLELLHRGVLVWLQLCVLEDRLGRLRRLAAAGHEYRIPLIRELLVRRTWDVCRYPQWLVFEVEGRLQIRPEQYAVAVHLMSHPGAIAQLNMGEGKTRVILPMLALHWADGSQVVRLNLVSTLLEEAYGHLHNTLCAGVLGRKLFTLPFHRGVEVTAAQVEAMRASLQLCKREGGLLLVAPEHRLSLFLKRLELGLAGPEKAADCEALDRLAELPYMDLLDESDELLHHRLQLIYACGAPTTLPNLHERTAVIQALLRVASRLAVEESATFAAGGDHKASVFLPRAAAVLEPPPNGSPGAFCGLRLLPGEALEAEVRPLHRRLMVELMDDPPYDLRWLKEHALRDHILRCATDEAAPAAELLGSDAVGPEPHQLSPDQLAVVLALRGLLACNLLQHCLQKRHQVDYGINRNPGARKRMAVPYRAAHTPAERSEFAQPDVALLLTNLSYYYDGLSRDEFLAALKTLLAMGLSAQRDYYAGWMELSRDRIPEADLARFREVDHVDPDNGPQVDLMYGYLRHNMAVVDFWLNHRVLPTESRQYPQRLAASAWHLADNARACVVGFSGTNDNHRLLPLQVHQAGIAEHSLRATNGKMLHVIMQHTLGFHELKPQDPVRDDGRSEPPPLWRVLLDTALNVEADALLDCGALLAGASNRRAAEYVQQQLTARRPPTRFQGVTYFDEAARSWMVRDLRGRTLPRHASPIAERQTFVIYDDARCRGADLQLEQRAVGLLTLGPGACKDKVMQAAGRLRQLGRGQQLRFAAAADVASKIFGAQWQAPSRALRPPRGPGSSRERAIAAQPAVAVAVLRWVMKNTVDATQRGLVTWASQGLHFVRMRHVPPEGALHDEVLKLDELYGGGKAAQPAADVVAVRAVQVCSRAQQSGDGGGNGAPLLPTWQEELVSRITAQAAKVGNGHWVVAGAAAGDEECERELEEEEEEEEEVERQVAGVEPRRENDWNYGAALGADSISALGAASRLVRLAEAAALLAPASLRDIPWPEQVHCTGNFLHAVGSWPQGVSTLNEYLRPVGALLLLPSGELLLLSEREADQLHELAVRGGMNRGVACSSPAAAADAQQAPLLVDLCYAREATTKAVVPALAVPLVASGASPASAAALQATAVQTLLGATGTALVAGVQLFNGETSYGIDGLRGALRALVWRRREDVEALVDMRGKTSMLPRSDLERACEDL